ncbi:FYVE, RhoGEF and PH domain-containing protein 4-like isoform X1 [Portunus trituberculatus]|nr:FYVE, RhoGEF and PH domain-containing protein 4-like isoform X1 [Portunus trituberculatus]XP_045111960.1 FYVE, RhoGEF and PH domain-containing protein 4-like isoform X1 [Portunus trituberculatus]
MMGVVGGGGGGGGSRGGSGNHSNDSGVALLLERAHLAFGGADHTPSPTPTTHRTSDQDSLPEQPSLLVPPSVYDYVAGLRNHPPAPPAPPSSTGPLQDTHAPPSRPGQPPNNNNNNNKEKKIRSRTRLNENSLTDNGTHSDFPDDDALYDSDSSLTIAANKSLSLTTSLSQQCDLELHQATSAASSTRANSTSEGSEHGKVEGGGVGGYCRHLQFCPRENGKDTTTTTTTTDPYQTPSPVGMGRGGDLSDPREARRYRVAKELLDTEKKYCRTLWTIQDTFAEPLKKANILSRKDISTLFPEEVYQLYDKHSILQHQLRERLGSWKWQPLVGDVVARFTDPRQSDVLRLYTTYVNDFPEVLKTFRKMCHTSQPFTRFIKGCLEQPACGGLDLGAFLLTPVQRIPKYILLIKQLLRYTESTHLDYLHLHTCLDRLRDFLARLNDSMEHSFQLVHIHLAPPPSAQVEEEKVVHLRHLSQFEEVKDGGVLAASSGYHHHHHHHLHNGNRIGRLPRRSTSSLGSPTTSPTLSPPGSLGGGSPTRPPQRSLSSAGVEAGGGRRHRDHHQHRQPLDSRSSSLPQFTNNRYCRERSPLLPPTAKGAI